MSLSELRKKLGLSQMEFSVLTGIPLGTVKNQEQERRVGGPVMEALIALLEADEGEMHAQTILVKRACEVTYESLGEAKAVMKLISSLKLENLAKSLLQVTLHKNNPDYRGDLLDVTVIQK